jgi:hypothetical protein
MSLNSDACLIIYKKGKLFKTCVGHEPIPVGTQSKAWVYRRSLAGIVGLNLAGGMDVCLL